MAVATSVVRQGDLHLYLTALGSVSAWNTVTVRSRVDGQLMKLNFKEGQVVKKGDVLAAIDLELKALKKQTRLDAKKP